MTVVINNLKGCKSAKVHYSDFVDALPTRPEDKALSMGNVVNLFN